MRQQLGSGIGLPLRSRLAPQPWEDGQVTPAAVTIDHRVMGGVPCIAGTRIPVATVVGLLGQGYGIDEVLAEYPTLTREGILAALRYAASAVDERELPLRLSA
jgi:uncharacterized protein (DUF433 family)